MCHHTIQQVRQGYSKQRSTKFRQQEPDFCHEIVVEMSHKWLFRLLKGEGDFSRKAASKANYSALLYKKSYAQNRKNDGLWIKQGYFTNCEKSRKI